MALTVFTAPTAEPLTVEEAKSHLRVTDNDAADEASIALMIAAAREYCERWCRRTFPTTTLKLTLDRFPPNARAIVVPCPPLVSVTSIVYADPNGTATTLPANQYVVDNQSEPGRIVPAYSLVWPTTRGLVNDVTITLVAGSASVRASVKQAMLLLVCHWYEHRGSVVVGTTNSQLEQGLESLLWTERHEI